MIALGITAVVLFGYTLAGLRVAKARRPQAWATARRTWSMSDRDAVRASARWMTFWTVPAWPGFVIYDWLVPRLDRFAEGGDPQALADRAARLEAHIRDLERENHLPPMDLS